MKLRVAIILTLSMLFLSGCGAIDRAIDDAVPLKSMAFINLSQSAAKGLLSVLQCLVPIALLGIISGLKKQNWGKVRKMFGLMFGVGILPYILPAIEQLGRATWPEALTLSWIATQLGWTFPIPVGDTNPLSFIWALSFILNWPLFHAAMQIVTSVVLIICVAVAIMTWSWRPLGVAAASIAGWILAPEVVKNVTELLGSIRPDNAIVSSFVAFNLIYLVTMLILGLVTYFLPPILAIVYMPSESADEQESAQDELPAEGTGADASSTATFVPFPFTPNSSDDGVDGGGSGGNGPQGDSDVIYAYPPNDGLLSATSGVVDGQVKETANDEFSDSPKQVVYGADSHDLEDELPVIETGDEKSRSASVDAATIVVSDDVDKLDELPTTQTQIEGTITQVGTTTATIVSDTLVSDDDVLPTGPSDLSSNFDDSASQSASDPFTGKDTIVISDGDDLP